ncbi:hypothetical protein [Thermomonospora echinospora]|uniref:hypothetical protein n=1 Tax=Thermomonospora echinospora TaxID=1992 RepID=UPI0011B029CE|nr:hypothetical protein [Thermomonospora echinospora]
MSGTGQRSFASVRLCWLGAAVGMACGVLLAGCSEESPTVALPTQTGSALAVPSSSPPSTSPESEAEVIKDAYEQFAALLDRAHTLPAASRRQHLSTYMTDPQLSRVLDRIEKLRADGLVAYGTTVVHIKSVLIDGNDATVHDCQDTRNAGLMRADTHKKISRGVKEENIKSYMLKGADGRWRISKSVALGEGC